MLFRMIIKVAFKSLLANKLRSLLSVLGVIVGVAAVIAMLAIVSGFHTWALGRIKSFGANQLTIVPGARGSGGVISGTEQNLTADDAYALCDVPHVVAVSPLVENDMQSKYLNHNINADVLGAAPTLLAIDNYQFDHGADFSDDDVDDSAHVAVLTQATATALFGESDPVGKIIKIQGLRFRVVGLVKNRGGDLGFSEKEILVPYTTAMHALMGTSSLEAIVVEAEDGSDLVAVEHELVETLRNRHKILPGAPDDVHVYNQARFIDTVNQWRRNRRDPPRLRGDDFASSRRRGNHEHHARQRRRKDPRDRRPTRGGSREFDIMLQFLIESIIISCVGGVTGVFLGVGVAWLVEHLTVFHTAVQPSSIVLSLGFAAAVGVFFGFYPARRASKLDPVEALRYE